MAHYYKTNEFNNSEYCRILTELISGVGYLHSVGIAHRDLKPENVNASCVILNSNSFPSLITYGRFIGAAAVLVISVQG